MYSHDDVEPILDQQGSKASVSEVRRNGDGSKVYCMFWRGDDEIHVLARGGVESVIKPPPGHDAFLDDTGRFVAWVKDTGKGYTFRNGFFRATDWKGSTPLFRVDPSGQFYFATLGPQRTVVASVDEPELTLHEARFPCARLFYQRGRLYLFGQSTHGSSGPQDIPVEILGHDEQGWRLERALTLSRSRSFPSPFYVADMDPLSERVLIVDHRDLPFRGKLYLHDLASGTRVRVKGDVHPWMLFLKRDLLREPLPASPGRTG